MCLKDFGIDQIKWPHQAKSCHSTQVSPAEGQKDHCFLWNTSLYGSEPLLEKDASSGSIENHMDGLFIHRKIKTSLTTSETLGLV